ncbi:uncharacterized protein IL334_004485 [Kwoniella shivajii]|uniref:Siderochrome-iron transporter n=1 Tax=Kwoniella shivajii TaxID=564305 RepID=A0ABZ1D125_9TREE|nr:hypothetical protein IL334_004485 [Kwoniella shivajii]
MSAPIEQEGRNDTSTLPSLHHDGSSYIAEETEESPKRGIIASTRVLSVITPKDIHIAYAAYTLLALGIAFAQYTQSTFTAYATSAFKSHSELAAAGVVSRVFSMCAYALIISYSMMAGCRNVQTYVGANVFSGLGSTSYEIAIQIYIAETTPIVSRALWNVAADSFSYGIWSIINAVLAVPFICILVSWHNRVGQNSQIEPLPARTTIFDQLFHQYDIVGVCLLVASVALILVPLTLAKGLAAKWTDQNIAMICVGFGLLLLFVGWSLPKKYRPSWLFTPRLPMIPWYTLKDRSVLAMFVINMCDFMSYGCFTTYFQSFQQVAVRVSPAKASQIDNTLRIVFQVTAVVVGLVMRFWTPLCRKLGLGERRFHTKWPIWIGIPLCAIGIAIVPEIDVDDQMFQTSSQVAIQAAVKRGELAMATGIFYFAMSLGGAIGVAVAGSIWSEILPDAIRNNLPVASKSLAQTIFLAIVATCLQVPMLISMFFVKDVILTEEEEVLHAGRRLGLDRKKENRLSVERKGDSDVEK